MPITVDDPQHLNLTEYFLGSLDPPVPPLVAGDTWDLRFRVNDASDAPIDITGAHIAMVIKTSENAAAALLKRDTATDIAGEVAGTKQIALDAGQAVDSGDTGKGWFTIRFRPGDEAALLAIVASRVYDIRIRFADGSVREFARGRIQVLRPVALAADIP